MIKRPFWINEIVKGWEKNPIVWLAGPRRIGKTTLCRMLENDVLYLDCDLPSVEDMLKDPEVFFQDSKEKIIIFDEVHNLKDPSRILKIGADMFSDKKILATGSSTLAASRKFKDTLTGRKTVIKLLPVLCSELTLFGDISLQKRFFHGGLPGALLSKIKEPSFYREWVESFFSRDMQKLFGFRDWEKFNLLFEYIMRKSSGLFDVSKTASSVGMSRPTVASHISALAITGAIYVLRPFFGGGKGELIKMPKIYGFDTGFVSFFKGWDVLRVSDYGILLEHLVLESLLAVNPYDRIMYWRDKQGREIDFVLQRTRDYIDIFECKWNSEDFSPDAVKVFRKSYPGGENYLIYPGNASYRKMYKDISVKVLGIGELFNLGRMK